MLGEMFPMGEADPADAGSGVVREVPDVEPGRAALVSQWTKRIKHAKGTHRGVFERMRKDMRYARSGAADEWVAAGNYVANITQRHINQAVATLYAKNPKAVAKRRPRLEFKVWDGDPQSYQMAVQTVMANPMEPNAIAVVMEVEQARQRRVMLTRMGKTLEIAFNYYLDEQDPPFKLSMKQLVRRTKVCGVGFLELGFQRLFEQRPEISAQITDATDQLATMQRLIQDMSDGELVRDDPGVAELQATVDALKEQENVIAREGPVFGFPRSTEIVVDPACTNIASFAGARWIAREYMMQPSRIQEVYNVDIKGQSYTEYKADPRDYAIDTELDGRDKQSRGPVCVWQVQDKATGTCFAIADGYPDFLKSPAAPDVLIERFFTIFTLVFNDIEDEKEIYPPSDVFNMRHMQDELNRSRQGLREHRHANRPAYAATRGKLEDEDKKNLASRPANAIIELNSLGVGEKIEDVFQPIKPVGIDPNMYETNMVFEDVLRVVGTQEAVLGATSSGGSATEAAIGEGARVSTVSSDVDDLDEFLGEVAKSTSQLMLLEIDAQTIEQIVGVGAVWPQLSRDDIVKEVYLSVKAGSSGRPNRAAELANLERGMPFILQLPGLNPTPLAKHYLELLDIDAEEAVAEGLPSIIALNSMMGRQAQASTGDPATDPGQQGGRGGEVNSPKPMRDEPGPQAAMPMNLTGGQMVG